MLLFYFYGKEKFVQLNNYELFLEKSIRNYKLIDYFNTFIINWQCDSNFSWILFYLKKQNDTILFGIASLDFKTFNAATKANLCLLLFVWSQALNYRVTYNPLSSLNGYYKLDFYIFHIEKSSTDISEEQSGHEIGPLFPNKRFSYS